MWKTPICKNTRGGTRTHNLLLRREAPYPLGHTDRADMQAVALRVRNGPFPSPRLPGWTRARARAPVLAKIPCYGMSPASKSSVCIDFRLDLDQRRHIFRRTCRTGPNSMYGGSPPGNSNASVNFWRHLNQRRHTFCDGVCTGSKTVSFVGGCFLVFLFPFASLSVCLFFVCLSLSVCLSVRTGLQNQLCFAFCRTGFCGLNGVPGYGG